MNIIETERLTVRFGSFVAVSDVSLRIRAGHVHAVIGPNGAGKSTLLNLLAGNLRPSAGSIRFDGADITRLPMHRRVRLGISRSYQIVSLFAGMTCQQVVQLALQRDGGVQTWLSTRRARAVADQAFSVLAAAGLARFANDETTRLSHGLQKQLEIALALANDSRLLLLDEPMAGMSASERLDLGAKIRRLADRRTIVFVEHDVEMVMSLADTISVLHNGRLVAEGSPTDVRANATAQEIYLGSAARA